MAGIDFCINVANYAYAVIGFTNRFWTSTSVSFGKTCQFQVKGMPCFKVSSNGHSPTLLQLPMLVTEMRSYSNFERNGKWKL